MSERSSGEAVAPRLRARPAGPEAVKGAGPTVLQITRNLDIGGAQESVRTMAAYLPRVGCPTVVCTFRDGPLRPEIERLGVPVEVLPSRRYGVAELPWFAAEMAHRRRDLLAIVDRYGVDVVQTRGVGMLDFLAMTLRARRPIQVWWTIENVVFMIREEHQDRHRWLFPAKRAAHRFLYRTGARLVNGIVVVSSDTERSFRETVGYRGGKLVVVPNAVDVERYPAAIDRNQVRTRLGFGPDDHLMTMVGTFKRQKGHRYLVEAARAVASGRASLHILLVGDGKLAASIRDDVESAGLSDRIHFLGSRRDVPDLLAASDSFVLPSLWEGLPVALVEAMASGLPVIATAVSGTSEVMLDGRTGWIVPPGDADALAEAMADLLSDPAHAHAMGSAARARVAESFGALAQAEHLASLFRRGGPDASGRRRPATAEASAG